MVTYVNDYRALISGLSWSGADAVNKPTFITYSFEAQSYDYLNTTEFSDAFRKSFRPLTAAQKATALASLKQIDDASGIRFIEVAAGQGDIRFGTYDLSKDPNKSTAPGYATLPGVVLKADQGYIADQSGDIFLDDSVTSYRPDDLMHLLVHEIGHAVGLKHPFEGDVRLDPKIDNSDHTVMSYTGYAPKLGPIDIAALRYLYGDAKSDGKQVASWSWNAATATLTQTGGNGADTIRGITTADIMQGMGGDDILVSGNGKDRLDGGAGRDSLFSGAGDDTLDGGEGDDKLDGGEGNDAVNGGTGNDSLSGWGGNDTLNGGAGDDTLEGGDGVDKLDGGDGNDTINGRDGNTTAAGGAGNDILHGGRNIDQLDGGVGDDTVAGWDGADVLSGGAGRDNLFGGDGDDWIGGGEGDDSMNGDAGNDTLIGDAGKDGLFGMAGNDRLIGGAGDDWLNGGDGIDAADYSAATRSIVVAMVATGEVVNGTYVHYNAKGSEIGYDLFADIENVIGGQAADTITGSNAANVLDGRGGADRLTGGAGNDTYLVDNAGDRVFEIKDQGADTVNTTVSYALAAGQQVETLQFASTTGTANLSLSGNEFGQTLIGNAGANVLDGGLGSDVMKGGRGADTFVFTTKLGGTNLDHVADFAAEDTIQLSKSVFAALGAGNMAGTAFKNSATGKVDADDRIVYHQTTGDLFYDADGSGKAAAVKFAMLDNKVALTATDFFIV